jgi:hypothetical protein
MSIMQTPPKPSHRLLQNPATVKALAARERARLSQGYAPDSTFMQVLNGISDEKLVERWMNHHPLNPKDYCR